MRTAICHYSLHRTYVEKGWTVLQLARYVRQQGVDAIDFHVRFLGSPDEAPGSILEALRETGLALSGLSLSTNFNRSDPADLAKEIETAKQWLRVAGAVGAPASRVFGGHVQNRQDPTERRAGMGRVIDSLRALEPVARAQGVVLALENHGGLPCTGAEQAEVLAALDSPFCRATLDLGNYMQCPEDPLAGVRAALPYCAYVHVKDFKRLADGSLQRATIGDGDVDLAGCLRAIRDSGFDGFVALEYEGEEDELTGVPRSIAHMKKALASLE